MFKNIANAIGGNPQKREIERLRVLVDRINDKEAGIENLTDDALREMTALFRTRLAQGETLDDLLVEAFATVREASKRTIGLRHFNVQMIGGIAMHEGMIAEMRTGEGKTLVATLALYLNALAGKGAHLVTVNDYLARRDARWMAPIYHFLGLTVGVLQSQREGESSLYGFIVDMGSRSIQEENDQLRPVTRQQAYAADITYGTNNQFGFDYLRDNLITDIRSRVQRGHHYVIVDEVDNILIDEARTPLIISGPASEDVEWYSKMAAVVKQLDPEDYDFDEKDRSIALTEIGEIHVEELLQVPLRDPDRPEDITPQQARLLGYLEQALRAELLYRKNKDYIVKNNEVVIVDAFTGRLMAGRRWSEGLHQAVEAKESVKVNPENITQATITLQNYFRKYEKLSGMTGTALTEAEEFSKIYDLNVLEIPTNLDYEANQPGSDLETFSAKDDEGYAFTYYAEKNDPEKNARYWKRKDYPDLVYLTEEAKLRAICLEIIKFNIIGRPQLIGTTSIEHSERLSVRLRSEMIRRLLTAVLIRQQWMRNNDLDYLERVTPELAPLDAPLTDLDLAGMRQQAQQIGIQSIRLEDEENQNLLVDLLGLEQTESTRDLLSQIIIGGINHQVLNALKHDQESQIIEGAGAFRAVTIATNMAGRGVDIKLGGELKENVLSDVRRILTRGGIDPYGMGNQEMAKKIAGLSIELAEEEKESIVIFSDHLEGMAKVREAGGLHVIGSERHEARRIDNQLRGRSGRQGDPGSSRFYLSLEDDLMRMFGGERVENMMRLFNMDPANPIESKILGRVVEQAQQRVEGANFDIRKHLLDYDDVLNDQRERIYSERNQVLVKEDLNEDVWGMLENEVRQRVLGSLDDPVDGGWKLLSFLAQIQPTAIYPDQGIQIFSFPIMVCAEYARDKVGDSKDFQTIRSVLLEIAEKTLFAQKDHLLSQTKDLIQRNQETFNTQLAERMEMLDLFLDTMSDELSVREVNTQFQKFIRLKITLEGGEIDLLRERDAAAIKQVRREVTNQLKQIFISRIILTTEQRVGGKIGIDSENLVSDGWDEVAGKILSVINERLSENAGLHNKPNHPIIQNIDRLLKRQLDDQVIDLNLKIILAEMRFINQIRFDPETHQQTQQSVNILQYVFFAAQNCLPTGTEQLTQKIITHFSETQNKLRVVWGKMEMQRINENNLKYQSLPSQYREGIENNLGKAARDKLYQEDSLQKIFASQDDEIFQAFGTSVQQAVYRQILLRAISELWVEHLTRMEALRVSIGMEAYAQRDPLVQYKSYSTDNFKELLANIRTSVVSSIFRVQTTQPKSTSVDPSTRPQKNAPQSAEKPNKKKGRKRHKKKK